MHILTTPERYTLYKNEYITGEKTLVYSKLNEWPFCSSLEDVNIQVQYFPHWNDPEKLLITCVDYCWHSEYPYFNDFITTKRDLLQDLTDALNAAEDRPHKTRKIKQFTTWAVSDWNKKNN